jgi:hypothetical protein
MQVCWYALSYGDIHYKTAQYGKALKKYLAVDKVRLSP